jgi:hypothetical protein
VLIQIRLIQPVRNNLGRSGLDAVQACLRLAVSLVSFCCSSWRYWHRAFRCRLWCAVVTTGLVANAQADRENQVLRTASGPRVTLRIFPTGRKPATNRHSSDSSAIGLVLGEQLLRRILCAIGSGWPSTHVRSKICASQIFLNIYHYGKPL